MHNPVQYLIRKGGMNTLSLREITRNVRGNQLEVIEALESDPAIKLHWDHPDGIERPYGSSVPMILWSNHPDLRNLPTYQWAMGEGLESNLIYFVPDDQVAHVLRGDFDEMAPDPGTAEPPFQPEESFRTQPMRLPTAEEIFDAEEPEAESPDEEPSTELISHINHCVSNLLRSMTINPGALPDDARFRGDEADLFVWLSRTTYGDSVWRSVRHAGIEQWVPIALHPDWGTVFSPADLVEFLTRSKALLGDDRWRQERGVLGLGTNPAEIWASTIDESPTVPTPVEQEEVEEEAPPTRRTRRDPTDIGHGVWLETTAIPADDLLSVKEVIEAAQARGFTKYLALKAMGGDHCPNPPLNSQWTVYYDPSRRRWLHKDVLITLNQDLAFLKSIAHQRAAAGGESES